LKKIAVSILLLSILMVSIGFFKGEWKKIYANGRTLCLTCIGIK